MKQKTSKSKDGNIRAKQKLIDDANNWIKNHPEWNSLPHLVKVLICKTIGKNPSDY